MSIKDYLNKVLVIIAPATKYINDGYGFVLFVLRSRDLQVRRRWH